MKDRKLLFSLFLVNLLVAVVLNYDIGIYHDYRAFYGAGVASRQSAVTVYNWDSQIRIQAEFVGVHPRGIALIPFFHPPLELPVFRVLAIAPYQSSLNLWRALSLLMAFLALSLVAKSTGTSRNDLLLLLACSAPTAVCLVLGQDAMLLLLIVAACLYLDVRGREVYAGLVLSLGVFRPELPVVLAVALLCAGRRKLAGAFTAGAALLTAVSLLYLRTDGIHDLLRTAHLSQSMLPIFIMPSIRGVIALVSSDHQLLAVSIWAIGVVLCVPVWRHSESHLRVYASAICLACLLSPHVFAYELVALIIPIALLMDNRRPDGLVTILLFNPLALLLTFTAGWMFFFPTAILLRRSLSGSFSSARSLSLTSDSPATGAQL